jgi:hypothetical protein
VVLPEGYFQRAYAQLAGSDEADPSEAHSWQRMTKGLDNSKYGSLQERIVKDQQKEASKKKISCWTNTYQMAEKHRVWWKEDQIVVAGDNDLKRGVIHYFHDTPSAGHPGITNTYNLAKHDTWWLYMKQDVECYNYAQKDLDSAVMTTQAKSRISHGLLVVVSRLTDPKRWCGTCLIVLLYHMYL